MKRVNMIFDSSSGSGIVASTVTVAQTKVLRNSSELIRGSAGEYGVSSKLRAAQYEASQKVRIAGEIRSPRYDGEGTLVQDSRITRSRFDSKEINVGDSVLGSRLSPSNRTERPVRTGAEKVSTATSDTVPDPYPAPVEEPPSADVKRAREITRLTDALDEANLRMMELVGDLQEGTRSGPTGPIPLTDDDRELVSGAVEYLRHRGKVLQERLDRMQGRERGPIRIHHKGTPAPDVDLSGGTAKLTDLILQRLLSRGGKGYWMPQDRVSERAPRLKYQWVSNPAPDARGKVSYSVADIERTWRDNLVDPRDE